MLPPLKLAAIKINGNTLARSPDHASHGAWLMMTGQWTVFAARSLLLGLTGPRRRDLHRIDRDRPISRIDADRSPRPGARGEKREAMRRPAAAGLDMSSTTGAIVPVRRGEVRPVVETQSGRSSLRKAKRDPRQTVPVG